MASRIPFRPDLTYVRDSYTFSYTCKVDAGVMTLELDDDNGKCPACGHHWPESYRQDHVRKLYLMACTNCNLVRWQRGVIKNPQKGSL